MYATGECDRFDKLTDQIVKRKLKKTDIHYNFAISHSEITSASDIRDGREIPKWAWFGNKEKSQL